MPLTQVFVSISDPRSARHICHELTELLTQATGKPKYVDAAPTLRQSASTRSRTGRTLTSFAIIERIRSVSQQGAGQFAARIFCRTGFSTYPFLAEISLIASTFSFHQRLMKQTPLVIVLIRYCVECSGFKYSLAVS
jgi:hypothetical protein